MKKLVGTVVELMAMGVVALAIVALALMAGKADREAQSKTYVLHGTYDGFEFKADNGQTWEFEQDILTWYTFTYKGEPSFMEYTREEFYEKVEPNTLVHVKINDNGTDDLKDDYPVIVAYDDDGMFRRMMKEFDESMEVYRKQIEINDKVIDALEKDVARLEMTYEICTELKEAVEEVK